MEFLLLGPVQAIHRRRPACRPRPAHAPLFLAVLLAAPEWPVPADTLITRLWDNSRAPPGELLHGYASKFRTRLTTPPTPWTAHR
jgi:hypothetical protein